MPKTTLGEMTAKHSQDSTPEEAPTTYWTRGNDDTITYVFDGREVEYEEYLDLIAKDSSISGKDRDIMISEAPAPGDPA